MVHTVYVDLLFVIDFSMDFLCFYITSRLLHKELSPLRTAIGAVIGGLYSVFAVFFTMDTVYSLMLDIAVCLLMCIIVFRSKGESILRLLKLLIMHLFVSATLGGIMTALFNFLNRADILGGQNVQGDGTGAWVFAILALSSGLISTAGCRFMRRSAQKRECLLRIYNGGRSVELRGLNDSGNLLRDVVSGKCVIPVKRRCLSGLYPEKLLVIADGENMTEDENADYFNTYKLKLIPGHTATGARMLVAFSPEKIEICCEGSGWRTIDALIAPIRLDGIGIESLVPDELMK